MRTLFSFRFKALHGATTFIELWAFISTDTARMASDEEIADKTSQKLTGAALEKSNVAKLDNNNEESAEIKKEGANELPIRDTPKLSNTTPDEKQRMVLTLLNYEKNQWPCHLRMVYFNMSSNTRISFP